jgi:histidyl-tRNA synthetase
MDKVKLQTLKGFRDLMPEDMSVRNEIVERLKRVFEKYGFSELQTPALEYEEVLLGKYGEAAEKLMYLFKDPGGRGVGLKYDLTVPLARVVAIYQNLPKPFKRYQIQPVWRAESPQKGRYREFWQCDVDIVDSSSPIADAEIIAVINDSLKALDFAEYEIKINSRKVLFSLMEKADIPENKWLETIRVLDKLGKKEKDEIEKELSEKGFSSEQIENIFSSLEKSKPDEHLERVIEFAKTLGVKDELVFDPNLARGLDYYTGPIFESVVEKPEVGSVTGGGRYDNLLKDLGGPDLPATGTTIGLDRVAEVIKEKNLWPDLATIPTKILVTIFSQELLEKALSVASMLRKEGINTEVFEDEEARLEKQLKYADKKDIPWAIIVGPEEAKAKKVVLKNLKTGDQETLEIQSAIKKIK